MNQPTLDFCPDNDKAGYRLHEVSVYNWGSFHGVVHTFNPDGRTALLTGPNAAGKSTLADVLPTLLVHPRLRNYNQAGTTQQHRERTERAYVMGTYAEQIDEATGHSKKQHLRPEKAGTYTVLLAHFRNEELGMSVSLAQVLWIDPSSGKVKKLHFVKPTRLTIKGDFDNLESPSTIERVLKSRGLVDLGSFSVYSTEFHKLLCLPEKNQPMAIFNQAISVKDISDLTSFIRTYMLDDGGAMEKLDTLRSNFMDLRATDARIKLATLQRDALEMMKMDDEALTAMGEERDRLKLNEDAMVPFLAEKEVDLRESALSSLTTAKAIKESEKLAKALQVTSLEDRIKSIDESLEASDEGRRLKAIDAELQVRAVELKDRKETRHRYDAALKAWSPQVQVYDTVSFGVVQRGVATDLPVLRNQMETLDETTLPKRRDEREALVREQAAIEIEYRSLLERTTNIPQDSLRARDFIVKGLGLRTEDLPFVGEILQVKSTESTWTGALEHLVHNFALRMVVRPELEEAVDSFVNLKKQRGLVVYDALPDHIRTPNAGLRPDAVAAKLEIKGGLGAVGEWVRSEISYRFDHACCEDTQDRSFREARNALTRGGMVKAGGTTRRKDDRTDINDASHYVMGWDNREKLAAVKEQLTAKGDAIEALDRALGRLKDERTSLNTRIVAGDKLQTLYSAFSSIDWEFTSRAISTLESERDGIKRNSNQLKQLQEDRGHAAKSLEGAKTAKETLVGELAVIVKEHAQHTSALGNAKTVVAAFELTIATEPTRAGFRGLYPGLKALVSVPIVAVEGLAAARKDIESAISKSLRKLNQDTAERSASIRARMKQFAQNPENIEFKDRVAGEYDIPGYSSKLYEPFEAVRLLIVEQDLPKNEARFQDLLHTRVTEDVASFDQLLDTHRKTIAHRIAALNVPLRRITFDKAAGTYIVLKATHTEDAKVKDFRALCRHALEGSLNGDDRSQLKERYLRIQQLLDRLDQDEKWTKEVIDVRNWFSFQGDEYFRAGDVYRCTHSGALSKSGGEKSRLASTILATGIAYQYGIALGEAKSESFRLVVVDEIFSRTDNDFSEYLLTLFKEFHLQLLMVQPMDAKIYLVEKYAERYHVVTKTDETSKVRNMSVHEFQRMVKEQVPEAN